MISLSEALNIIQDPTLTYKQELLALARLGESTDDSLRYSDEYYEAKRKGALCDLNEGCMPYRPRYICPDYELLFRKGCKCCCSGRAASSWSSTRPRICWRP